MLHTFPGENPGGNLNKVPGVLGHKLLLAVTGVEVPVVFVILEWVKLPSFSADELIHIDIGHQHTGAGASGSETADSHRAFWLHR